MSLKKIPQIFRTSLTSDPGSYENLDSDKNEEDAVDVEVSETTDRGITLVKNSITLIDMSATYTW